MAYGEDDSGKVEVWERQPGESSRAYAAFVKYRELGPQRSLAKVSTELSKSIPLIKRWSRTHQWGDRVDAWEADEDRERSHGRRAVIREACDRHVSIARAFTGKVAAKIKSLDIADMTPADAARWLDVAVKVERLGLGMSTNNHEVTGRDGGPMEILHGAKARLASLLDPLVAEVAAGQVDGEPDE